MEKTFEADVVSVKRSVNTKNGNPRYIVEFVGLSGLTVKFRTKDDVCFSKNLEYLAGEHCRITLERKRIRDMEKVETGGESV